MGQFSTNPVTTLDEWNALLANGCGCELPGCCPPLLECQSLWGGFYVQGYVKPDSGSDGTSEVYLKFGDTRILTGGGTVSGGIDSDDDAGDCGYSSSTWSIDARSFNGDAYTRAYHGGIGYDTASSGSGGCPVWPLESPVVFCSASGSSTITHSDTKCWGGGGSDPPTAEYAVSSVYTYAIDEAEGDLNPDWTAWDAEFGEGYAEAKAAYEAYLEDVAAYDAWVAAGEIPPAPPLPADPPPDLPVDPPIKFFGPCDFKVTETINILAHYFGKNFDGSSAEPTPAGEDPTFADWIAAGAPAEWGPPCSGSGDIIHYTDSPLAMLTVVALGPVTDTLTTGYEGAVTGAEWLTQVQALMAAAEFPNEDCMDDECSAFRALAGDPLTQAGDLHFTEQIFRYRWKLDKCCGTYSALSWLEVFYSDEFIDWLGGSGSGSSPDTPATTAKAWEFIGTATPDECFDSDGSDSTLGSADSGFNPFDNEDYWSPWSLTVRVPEGENGGVHLRNLYMTCWRSAYGSKPQYIPLLDLYDSSDLNEDGIHDSQQ